MKLIAPFALANATLAAVSTLLAAAPFTGALLLFMVWVPLAAYFARRNQTITALCVPVFAVIGLVLSPFKLDHASLYLLGVWGVWVLLWSALVVYFSRAKLVAVINALRGGGVHGA